jgi:hypothetical protein
VRDVIEDEFLCIPEILGQQLELIPWRIASTFRIRKILGKMLAPQLAKFLVGERFLPLIQLGPGF